jgi:uncharacterized protein
MTAKTIPDRCLIMFVRAPEKGRVKSRLAAGLDEDRALGIYKAMVSDLLNTFAHREDLHLAIFYYPPEEGQAVGKWLRESLRAHSPRLAANQREGIRYPAACGGEVASLDIRPQTGPDLGERMKHALTSLLEEFRLAVLIGSDSPDLTAEIINEAFDAFETCHAVIGPSCDGGYYLIGFRSDTFLPDAFRDMTWGSDRVFNHTMERLRGNGMAVHLLPLWLDIDRFEDLEILAVKHENSAFKDSETMKCLRSLGKRLDDQHTTKQP